MTTFHDDHTGAMQDSPDAAALREEMIGEPRTLAAIQSNEVAQAFRAVPRHLFVPGESVETAYASNRSALSKPTTSTGTRVPSTSTTRPWVASVALGDELVEHAGLPDYPANCTADVKGIEL